MGRDRIATPFNSGGNTVLGTVEVSNDVGNPIPVSGTITAGAQFAEDAVAASGALGTLALVVRKDAEGTNVSADGDYATLLVDSNGRLKVALAASYAEDSASTDADKGLFVLAVRHDADTATVGADGDYSALQTNANGRLKVAAAPAVGTLVDRSGAIATGGTAQVAMAANGSRKYLLICNPIDTTGQNIATAEPLWINFTTAAVGASPSIRLGPGDTFVMEAGFCSTEAVSVIAATTAHVWTAKESS